MGKGGHGDVDEPLTIAEPDGDATVASAADTACIAWVKAHVALPALRPEMWSVEHDDTIAEFLTSPNQRRLLAFVDPVLGLSLQFSLPQEAVPDLLYLLKPAGAAITAENIGRVVQYGSVRGAPVGAMLRLMSGVFMPLCLNDQSWPDTIKKEFSGQLQKFMASLTETAWDAQGKTMLYIPLEQIESPEAAAKRSSVAQADAHCSRVWTVSPMFM